MLIFQDTVTKLNYIRNNDKLVEAAKQNYIGLAIRQFTCAPCDNMWWCVTPRRKPVSFINLDLFYSYILPIFLVRALKRPKLFIIWVFSIFSIPGGRLFCFSYATNSSDKNYTWTYTVTVAAAVNDDDDDAAAALCQQLQCHLVSSLY